MEKNFGELNAIFLQNIADIIKSKDTSKIIKEYVDIIKSDENLLKEYILYQNIEGLNPSNDVNIFIIENISYSESLDKKKLKESHKKLSEFLKKNDMTEKNEIHNKEMFECIDSLIFMKKGAKHINEKVANINKIASFINEKTIVNEENYLSEDIQDKDLFYEVLIDNYNKKYSEKLTESQIDFVKSIAYANSEDDKKNIFETKRSECLVLTNNFLKESIDNDTKEKLLNVKEKLLDQKYIKESYIEDLISLENLKNTLS